MEGKWCVGGCKKKNKKKTVIIAPASTETPVASRISIIKKL